MASETAPERAKRHRQRVLFDAVAELYDDTRAGYPTEIVDDLFRIAGLTLGSRVLEVGCGTGQLTVDVARRGVALTAIDLGPAMVAATRRKVREFEVTIETSAFEDFDPGAATFAAVLSATAIHWIDPDIAWAKSAEILQPGGWIAILYTGERYDDAVGRALQQQWIRYSTDGGAWAATAKPTPSETIASTGLFHEAVTSTHRGRRAISADAMVRLEQTRATTLSYDPVTRQGFLNELRDLLDGLDNVTLTQETTLTMARVK